MVYDSSTCNEHLTTCEGLAGARVTLERVDTEALAAVREARQVEILTRLQASGANISHSEYADKVPQTNGPAKPFTPLAPSEVTTVTLPISGTVITGPDGFFAFPVGETGQYWLRVEKDGYTYGQREAEIVKEHSAATNEIYLTPVDPAVSYCDDGGCIHTSSDGVLQVEIPAGAISPGDLVTTTATNYEHVEFLPSGELPPGTWETYAFDVSGDSEITFTQPVTVRIQNRLNFSPTTKIPLGYWNAETMQWEHSGTGVVDASDAWVVMTVTHFSPYDCNSPISEPELDTDEEDEEENDDTCPVGENSCFINLKSGELKEWFDLPPVNIMGDTEVPQLRYSSQRAKPSAVIDIKLTVSLVNAAEIGDHIGFELYIEGEKTDSFYFEADLDGTGEVGRYRYLWDGRNAQGELMQPGVYEYAVKLSIPYLGQYCYSLNEIFGGPPDCEFGATGVFVDAVEDVWVRGTVELDSQPANPYAYPQKLDHELR